MGSPEFQIENPEQQMEEIVAAIDEALASLSRSEDFSEKTKAVVECLDKPELSKDARAYMDKFIGVVRENLDQSKNYADADIEAAIRALLDSLYSK